MRKLNDLHRTLLSLIAQVGGSFCPSPYADPMAFQALNELVKAKRLTAEPTDDGPRYHLTAKGRADASS